MITKNTDIIYKHSFSIIAEKAQYITNLYEMYQDVVTNFIGIETSLPYWSRKFTSKFTFQIPSTDYTNINNYVSKTTYNGLQ